MSTNDIENTLNCLLQQYYCSQATTEADKLFAIFSAGLFGAQMLYAGGLYEDYHDDLNDKLVSYRDDLRKQLEHYCVNMYGELEEDGEDGLMTKLMDFACQPFPNQERSFLKKTKDLANIYDKFLKENSPKMFEECSPMQDALACTAAATSAYFSEYEQNQQEIWNVANIEVIAQATRGQRQLSSEIKSLRQVAIQTCEGLLTTAASMFNSGGIGLGMSIDTIQAASDGWWVHRRTRY